MDERGNLTPYQRAELALKMKPLIAEKARANEIAGGGSGNSGRQKSDNPIDTKKELARVAGVSHDTIHKAAVIAEKAKERMLAGKPLDPVQNSAQGKTRDALAKVAGVSHDTIHKAALIAAKAKDKQRKHGGTAPGKTLKQKSVEVNTQDELAKAAGVSHNTQDL